MVADQSWEMVSTDMIDGLRDGDLAKRDGFQLFFPELLRIQPDPVAVNTSEISRRGDEEPVHAEEKRGPLSTFLWGVTRVMLVPTGWVSGISMVANLGGLACTITGLVVSMSKTWTGVCAGISLVSTLIGGFSIAGGINKAWQTYQDAKAASSSGILLQQLPFYGHHTVKRDPAVTEALDGLIRELGLQAIASMGGDNEGIVYHDILNSYAVVSESFLFGKSEADPAYVGISQNGQLLFPAMEAWLIQGEGDGLPVPIMNPLELVREADIERRQQNCWGTYCACRDQVTVNYGHSGSYKLCNQQSTSGGISHVYYGTNFYGNRDQYLTVASDVGAHWVESNGVGNLAKFITESAMYDNWWQACVCKQVSGQWVSTGAIQYTWNNGPFNGIGHCWAANCAAT